MIEAISFGFTYKVDNWYLPNHNPFDPDVDVQEVIRKGDAILLWSIVSHNMIPTVGANKFLDATMVTGLASPLWYFVLFQGASAPAFAVTDTMAAHAWSEITTAMVTNSTRPQWIPGSISSGTVSNSASPATFTIAASQSPTLQGCGLCDGNSIGGASGTLLSEALFGSGAQTTSGGNIINITGTMQAVAG